jgi:energy-coupling factor transporter ATP-binding protein EcfA2
MNKSSRRGKGVLEEAAKNGGLTRDELASACYWLADQLSAHEYAKLGQGGHTSTQVPLRRVFVDLPVKCHGIRDEERTGFLQKLVAAQPINLANDQIYQPEIVRVLRTNEKLSPSAPTVTKATARNKQDNSWGAVLLIGGPGQGKSTLSQLACQLHRAILLSSFRQDLTVAQAELVASFVNSSSNGDGRTPLVLPKTPLLPLQIALPDLMAWINKSGRLKERSTPVLLAYVEQLPSASRLGFTAKMIVALAKSLGCLIVLDGFDEVGAADDRKYIVDAGTELLQHLKGFGINIQIVVTTRPQGYSGEMERMGLRLQEQVLLPLEKNEAINYAQRLINEKIPGADQRQTMMGRMLEAADEPATQRLLTTPLQVTILTALVQQLGRAPRERWNLFFRYFSYTYDREIERNTYASALLADHRSHVEQIHARIALMLQVESEKQGGGAARLSKARLEEVISTVLSEEEVPPERKAQLIRDISKAAEERLVFLVEPEPGKFGFEIRSLQEFMAANALTTGRDSAVEGRLRQLSKAAMFRNTLLFCASRLFSEGSPLRDIFANEICTDLDSDRHDQASSLSKAGALLALETLEEGAVLTQPKRARLLMEKAVSLMALPPSPEHIRLAQVANNDTWPVVEYVITHHFAADVSSRRLNDFAVWFLLLECVKRNLPNASTLADRNLEALIFDHAFFEAQSRLGGQIGEWLIARVERAAASISPIVFLTRPLDSAKDQAQVSWIDLLIEVLGPRTTWLRRRSQRGHQIAMLQAVEHMKGRPKGVVPEAWRAWAAAVDFEAAPSSSSLAKALRLISSDLSRKEIEFLCDRTSWPLAACLSYYSSEELMSAAILIERKEFGDTADWIAAQESWDKESPPMIESLLRASHAPLTYIKIAPPIQVVPIWNFFEPARERRQDVVEMCKVAAESFHSADRSNVRQTLANICLACLRYLPIRASKKGLDVAAWLSAEPTLGGFLFPRPPILKVAEWVDLLGKDPLHHVHIYGLSPLDKELEESNCHPQVIAAMVQIFLVYAEHSFGTEFLNNEQAASIDKSLESHFLNFPPDVAANGALLRLVMGQHDQRLDLQLVSLVLHLAATNLSFRDVAARILATTRLPKIRAIPVLAAYLQFLGINSYSGAGIVKFFRDHLQKTVSSLDNPFIWDKLGLPLPRPRSEDELTPKSPFQSPVSLKSIALKDVCGIANITMDLATSRHSDKGQWIIILGKNGVGKTTLLRSLALSLRNLDDPSIWPKGSFSHQWIRVSSPGLDPIREASIRVELNETGMHEVAIRAGDTFTFTQQPTQSSASLFPIYAYGCRRGSALGGAARALDLGEDDGPGIATLFDEGAGLIHAETWLINLDGDASKNKKSASVLESVYKALRILLDVEDITVASQRVWITQKGGPPLPLSSMSDGYLTATGWFLDIVARWIVQELEKHEFDDRFLESMVGLVLIDEIDLHLHPKWQIEIIRRTRTLMPKMTFVVTTHNPLTLIGADASEIWIMENESGLTTVRTGIEDPVHLSGGQIYNQYFGVDDVYPDEMGRVVQRYGVLVSLVNKTGAEEDELRQVRNVLDQQNLLPPWQSIEPGDSVLSLLR